MKYEKYYRPGDTYWGIGVEHETYIQTSKVKRVSQTDFLKKRKPERYSVNYYNVYKKETLDDIITTCIPSDDTIVIPILANAHTFVSTDTCGTHRTTYEKVPKPNPKFLGKTIIELLKAGLPDYFEKEYEKSYMFDGDTVEFMTQNFYCTAVEDVIAELKEAQEAFITNLNTYCEAQGEGILKEYYPFSLAIQNHGFASYLTNLDNIAMFNNGTLHINLTLPTKLDMSGNIADRSTFIQQHRTLIRVLQWLSPFIIAEYGSGDPFSKYSPRYASGSQRVAVSRYIGVGTYDTNTMEPGKILTKARTEIPQSNLWYDILYAQTDYVMLDNVGLDFNFNKHFSHGIEFRIFDQVCLEKVEQILCLCVRCMDFSLAHLDMANPCNYEVWHEVVARCVWKGRNATLLVREQCIFFMLFGVPIVPERERNILEVFEDIRLFLEARYDTGFCTTHMLRRTPGHAVEVTDASDTGNPPETDSRSCLRRIIDCL